jgi:hypothetical protein
MELAAQIRQRLGVTRIRPQLAGKLLPWHRLIAVQREIGEDLLLPCGDGARLRPVSGDETKTPEKFEAK